ncbi:xanthine dehydrogenase family protein molybdopterin-binding subunit [Pseudohalioglobus sediminis]|nr:molybdopterin cofactor-binding domain-containing protein [Pseudohalioglobus sediminis]
MSLSRREFIRNFSIAGGGLTLGFTLNAIAGPTAAGDLQPNAFLRITPQGEIIVQIHKVEMGQGTVTGLVTLIAEELEADPASVRYEMAPVDDAFTDPEYRMQITGGSNAIRVYYRPLRETGAAARAMLLAAASARSGLPTAQLQAERGRITSADGRFAYNYGELAAEAGKLPVPENPPLKAAADFRLIGKLDQRLDTPPKVNGSARFGIDAPLPETLVAVVVRPPVARGAMTGYDDSKARDLPGVHSIVAIDAGVAVVASNYWRARKAAEAVTLQWEAGDSALTDSDAIDAALTDALNGDSFATIRDDGEAPEAAPAQALDAEYSVPFLAHATMEPMNATVDPISREVWVGTQAPDITSSFAALGLGVEADEITVHNQFLGGGFGRRSMPDHVLEAAQVAAAVGKRVKLVWSREDDTQHDFYRPPMKSRLSAGLDQSGQVVSWRHRLAGPSLMQSTVDAMAPAIMPGWIPDFLIDFGAGLAGRKDNSSVEGADELPYAFGHIQVAYRNVETPVPLGFWRSVGHSHTAFVVESFVDELAHAAGVDPVAFRRRYLAADSRHRQVLDRVAELSNWGNAPAGHYQGVAVHESFHTLVAEVVEISMQGNTPKLERAFCAVHCGRAVNPDVVRQQMEGGMVFGLCAALKGEITLRDGAVQQGNFHDYPLLRINEVPEIEVAIIDSDAAPTGVGEPATPPAAPALGNAIFAATGQRLRQLPFKLS